MLDYRYGDQSFQETLWQMDRYIARIHGFVEAPRSIVLSKSAFDTLIQSKTYNDLLSYVFTRKNVMFLGFSFYDPAIRNVLEQINRAYGSAPPGRHIAFIPENADSEFLHGLSRLNIEAIKYSPVNEHRALWDAIDKYAPKARSLRAFTTDAKTREPFATARKFFAACYARARLGIHIAPLREVIIEGIVSGLLQSHLPKGVRQPEIVDSIHKEFSISKKDARQLVEVAIKNLRTASLCRLHKSAHGSTLVWVGDKTSTTFEDSIEILARSAADRAVVQEAWKVTPEVASGFRTVFKELVLQRGWDLGAAYATNRPPEAVDIAKHVRQSCESLSSAEADRIQRVCQSMLLHPSVEEAKVLSELGRVSFALELAIQAPRTILFHSAVLPERIYFDANVLMPALTPGHPFHHIYLDTIERLKKAAARASIQLQLVAYYGFLNEIVSHRRLAISEMEQSGDQYVEFVKREVLFRGPANVNVFVGAYANLALREPTLKFSEFLQRYAPYTNETELSKWLKSQGIVVARDNELVGPQYAAISFALQKAYSSGLISGKGMTLIEHDAYQLSGLAKDRANGRRVILVTADKTLRELVGQGEFSELAQNMVSHVGLAQMIDLLVGNPTEEKGMTGLLWVAQASDKTEALRSYLIALGLMEYDEGLAMEMPKVIDQIAEELNEALVRAHADPDSQDPAMRREAFRIMGIHEKGFFEQMRETIERRQRQGG